METNGNGQGTVAVAAPPTQPMQVPSGTAPIAQQPAQPVQAPVQPAQQVQPDNLNTFYSDAYAAAQNQPTQPVQPQAPVQPAPAAPQQPAQWQQPPAQPAQPPAQQPQQPPAQVAPQQPQDQIQPPPQPEAQPPAAPFTAAQQQALAAYWAQQQAQQQPPAAPPAPQQEEWTPSKHFASQWSVPEYNPQWDAMAESGVITKDENGHWVPTPGNEWVGANPALAELNRHERTQREAVQGIFRGNPYENIWKTISPVIEREIEERAAKILDQRSREQQTESYVNGFFTENLDALAGPGGQGLSPWGMQIADYCERLSSAGVTDHAEQLRLAAERYPAPPAQQPPAQQQLPIQQPQHAPAPPAAPQQPGQPTAMDQFRLPHSAFIPQQPAQPQQPSFMQDVFQAASHQPNGAVSPHAYQQPAQPMSDAELKNFYVNRFNEQQF